MLNDIFHELSFPGFQFYCTCLFHKGAQTHIRIFSVVPVTLIIFRIFNSFVQYRVTWPIGYSVALIFYIVSWFAEGA